MKEIYNVSNTIKMGTGKVRRWSRMTPFKPALTMLALLMVCLFGINESAWGKTYTTKGTIGVGKGKGTVQVEIWTYKVGDDTNDEQKEVSEGEDAVTVSGNANNSLLAWEVVYRYFRFWAKSPAEGYTFDAWYTNKACTEGKTTNQSGKDYYQTSTSNKGPEYVYYAKFIPNPYTIAYNNNGGSGSMSNTETEYDASVKLRKNSFTKQAYLVTYNANGGSGCAANAYSYYEFTGWRKGNASTGDQYVDEANVSNLTKTKGGTVTMYAQWGAVKHVILPEPTVAPTYAGDGEYSFAGWDDGAKVYAAGASYTPTSNITLTAKWTLTKQPVFSGEGQNMKVGDTYASFSFSNTSTETPSADSKDKFYYVIETTTAPTGNRDGSSYPNDVISFDGTTVTALNNGVATIKFYQDADASNNIASGESETYTFTVSKKDPVFTWSTQTYYYNSTYLDIFSSSNHDTQLTCSTTNDGAAEMVNGTNSFQKTLKTYNGASATITIEQAENYKWNYKKVDTYAITNNKANNHVAFTVVDGNKSTFEKSKTSNVEWNSAGYYKLGNGDWGISKPDDNIIIGFEGIPDILSFTLSCDPVELAGTHYPHKNDYTFEVFESATNGNWVSKWTNDNSADYSASENVQIQLSPSTRYIKLRYKGTCWGRFTNIAVSELQYFRRQGENTTLNFGSSLLSHAENEPAVQSFVVEHANAGYQTSVSAPSHYQVSLDNVNFASSVTYSTNATALTGGDKKGTFTVYVKYLADEEGTHEGNVVVRNNLRTDISVPVTGTTQGKLATHLVYKGQTSYNINTANIAATDLFEVRDANNVVVSNPVITLSTNHDDTINVVNNNTAIDFICGGGKATITASYAGDNETYAAAEDLSQTITVTRNSDNVSWSNVAADGKIHVWADHDISPLIASANTRIWYGTGASSKLEVTNGATIGETTLHTKAYGEVTISAASEGDCTYNPSATSTKTLVVEPCRHEIVWDQKFLGYITDEDGNINEVVTLNAYAVDSLGNPTGVDVSYELVGKSVASVSGKTLTISGLGVDTIKVRTVASAKYATAYDERPIRVRKQGSPCGSDVLDVPALKRFSDLTDNTYVLTGPAKQLTCQVKKLTIITITGTRAYLQGWSESQKKWVNLDTIYEEVDNTQWTNLTYNFKANESRDITKIKFYNAVEDGSKNVRNVRVSQLPYITPNKSSVTMSTVKACEEATGEFNVDYSDVAILQLEQTNNDFTYEVWKDGVKQDGFENDCEEYGTYTIKFKYTPQVVGPYSNTVTISSSGISQTVTLSGIATKPERYIVWDVDHLSNATATTSVTLGAYPRTSCQESAGSVTYSLSATPSDAATITGTTLSFHKQGTVIVTAHAAETDDYLAAVDSTKIWNIGLVNAVITAPTITSTITYLDTKSVVTWADDWTAKNELDNTIDVAGSLELIKPASFTAAGDTYLTFVFHPTDIYTYNPVQFTVPVTVNQAPTTATANAIELTYGETPDSKAITTASAALEGTWSWNDERSDDALNASEDAYALNVIFTPKNTNYAPYATTVNVTVAQATTTATANAIELTYGETPDSKTITTASASMEGDWSWNDERSDDALNASEDAYALNVIFTPKNTNYASYATMVNVTVAKATTTLSWADGMATNLTYNGTATYTATSASDGAITYSVIDGEDYAHFDANVLTVDEPNHKITIQASQAAGTNYLAPTAITMEVTIAAAPLNEFTNATGNGKWDDPENWTSVPTGSDPTVIVSGALEIKNENVTVGNLTIESTGSVAVITGGTLTVKGTSENRSAYGDIHVMDDGALALGNSAHLEVRHFTLDAKLAGENNLKVKEAAASGQVSNEEKMNVNGNVYFQLSFDPLGYITYGWYNFTVPFPVDINGGISRVNSNNDKVMVSGQDFIVMEADELNRANGGKGWRRLNSGVLQPGKLYTITFDDEINQNTFQFAWNGQGSISNGESFATQCAPGSVETLRGWNGLGNGMLCHGHLDADYKKQLYDHGTNTYVTVAGEKTFAVGTAFFIQVPETISSVSWDEAAETVDRPMYAPKRVAREIEEFSLSLMDEEAEKVHDMLFFSASEDATEKYVIGKDLVKMGTPTEATVAQMWATKGGNKLCDIEAALINDQASTPLSIYAPKAGSYWFAIDEAPEDAMLYLTYNDEIIWDLNISPYLFDLLKGTTTGYGLRIEAKKAQAITTGVEQSEVSGQTMRKVIIDNRVYIVTPDGKMYDVIGKGVKF